LSTSNPGQEFANGGLCSTKLLSKSESQIKRLSFVMNSPCQCAHNPPTHTRIFSFFAISFLIFLSLALAPAHTVSPSLFSLSLSISLSLSLSLSLPLSPASYYTLSLSLTLALPSFVSSPSFSLCSLKQTLRSIINHVGFIQL
jgi:hypothetical protein